MSELKNEFLRTVDNAKLSTMRGSELDKYALAELVALLDVGFEIEKFRWSKNPKEEKLDYRIQVAMKIWYDCFTVLSSDSLEFSSQNQFKMARLACSLKSGISGVVDTEVKSRMKRAKILLDSSDKAIKKEPLYSIDSRLPLNCYAMKVGHHYMPEVSAQMLEERHDFKEALKIVIGLTRHEDRIAWYRAFLKWLGNDKTLDVLMALILHGDNPFPVGDIRRYCKTMEDILKPEDMMGWSKSKGFVSVKTFLGLFREWRLTMKTIFIPLAVPMDRKEAIARAYEKKD